MTSIHPVDDPGPTSTQVERAAREATRELVRLAVTASCAAAVGWPHTAQAAARALLPAARAASAALTPACSRLAPEDELTPYATVSRLEAALELMAPRVPDEPADALTPDEGIQP